MTAVLDRLRPGEHPYYVIHRLHESGLSGRFPIHALRLLAAIVSDQPWGAPELGHCLDLIVQADASLAQDPDYQRLREYARRGGSRRAPEPARHDLPRLRPDEAAVYDDLRFDRHQPGLRLEQERVRVDWLSAQVRSRL